LQSGLKYFKSVLSAYMNEENKPISISKYIELLNSRLREIRVAITGEVSEAKLHTPSGHMYFKLKDEEDESVLQCVIWKDKYEFYGIKLETGMKIIAVGFSDIWREKGNLMFKASAIELVGEGILKKRYDALKKKLTDEGLFELPRKRPIPKYPQRIGVVTSKTGEVIHDFRNNLGNFGFKVKIVDARVEGPEAVLSLLEALEVFKKIPIDVLVIMRGGGSIEALQAFDNEKLVREIVKFPVPVVAGIGHHQDVPLVALAADAMASTPTATAYLLNKSWEEAKWELNQYQQETIGRYANILYRASDLIKFSEPLRIIERLFNDTQDSISQFRDNFVRRFKAFLIGAQQKLTHVEQIIKANDPKRNLKLGYAIARFGGKVVRGVASVKQMDPIDLEVLDGIINTKVINIKKEK